MGRALRRGLRIMVLQGVLAGQQQVFRTWAAVPEALAAQTVPQDQAEFMRLTAPQAARRVVECRLFRQLLSVVQALLV